MGYEFRYNISFWFYTMSFFLGVLVLGFIYEWKKKALDWIKRMYLFFKKYNYVSLNTLFFFYLPSLLKPIHIKLSDVFKFKKLIVNIKHSLYNYLQLPSILLKKKFKNVNIHKSILVSSSLAGTIFFIIFLYFLKIFL